MTSSHAACVWVDVWVGAVVVPEIAVGVRAVIGIDVASVRSQVAPDVIVRLGFVGRADCRNCGHDGDEEKFLEHGLVPCGLSFV